MAFFRHIHFFAFSTLNEQEAFKPSQEMVRPIDASLLFQ